MLANANYVFSNGASTSYQALNNDWSYINNDNYSSGSQINANKIYWDEAEMAKLREMIARTSKKKFKLFWERAALELNLEDGI